MARKIEGGQGGKKGHSNMSHWEPTEDIKRFTKRKRRAVDRKINNDVKKGKEID